MSSGLLQAPGRAQQPPPPPLPPAASLERPPVPAACRPEEDGLVDLDGDDDDFLTQVSCGSATKPAGLAG